MPRKAPSPSAGPTPDRRTFSARAGSRWSAKAAGGQAPGPAPPRAPIRVQASGLDDGGGGLGVWLCFLQSKPAREQSCALHPRCAELTRRTADDPGALEQSALRPGGACPHLTESCPRAGGTGKKFREIPTSVTGGRLALRTGDAGVLPPSRQDDTSQLVSSRTTRSEAATAAGTGSSLTSAAALARPLSLPATYTAL